MAAKKDMTPAQKARQKASGVTINKIKEAKNIFSKPEVTAKAQTLAKNTRVGLVPSKTAAKADKYMVKQVPNDAYDTLAKLADAQNLTGQAREKAISGAFKVVSQRMQSDRNRTANRAESIEKRAAAKKTKSNKSKLIGG